MISYEPLFQTMERKNITAYRLVKMGFSQSTFQSIKHGNSMTMKTLNALCELLDCSVTDIIEYRKDAPQPPQKDGQPGQEQTEPSKQVSSCNSSDNP